MYSKVSKEWKGAFPFEEVYCAFHNFIEFTQIMKYPESDKAMGEEYVPQDVLSELSSLAQKKVITVKDMEKVSPKTRRIVLEGDPLVANNEKFRTVVCSVRGKYYPHFKHCGIRAFGDIPAEERVSAISEEVSSQSQLLVESNCEAPPRR